MHCRRAVPLRSPRLSDDSRCLRYFNIKEIHHSLPINCHQCDWLKLFSVSSESKSELGTLYRRCEELKDFCAHSCKGCITVIKDNKGNVFGSYTTYPWATNQNRIYHKNIFLFRIEGYDTNIYNLSSGRSAVQNGTPERILLKDGMGRFIFYVTSPLESGVSYPSVAFHSPHFSSKANFSIETLEIYAIVPYNVVKDWAYRRNRV